MTVLTGEHHILDAWRQFIHPDDIVGIKVNVVGRPWCVSSHAVVAETVRNLTALGLGPEQIYIYDRFRDQLDEANYLLHVPDCVNFSASAPTNTGPYG